MPSDRDGAAEFFPLLAAIMVFLGTFAALSVLTVQVSQRAVEEGTGFEPDVSASRLADTILDEPGTGWYSTVQCVGGEPNPAFLTPDGLDRFGLGAEDCGNAGRSDTVVLSLDKMRDLSKGTVAVNASNGHVDYQEARKSLSLEVAGQEFHLRSWPILNDLQRNLEIGYEDPTIKAAYLGAYDTLVSGVPTSFVVNKACGKTENAGSVDVWVDINNNGTTGPAFEVVFTVPLSSKTVEIRKHTVPFSPLGTTRVTATLPKTSDWLWAGTPSVSITVSDTIRSLGGCSVSLSGITMTSGSTVPINTAYAESLEKLLSGATNVKVYYDAFNGHGQHVNVDGWTLIIETSLGVPLATDLNLNHRGWETFSLAAAGNHIIKLKSSLGAVLDQNTLNLVASSLPPFTPLGAGVVSYRPAAGAAPEASYLARLVQDFTPKVHSIVYDHLDLPYFVGGDVYPVLTAPIAADFAPLLVDNKGTPDVADDTATLTNYNVIVVGSGSAHSELNTVTFKNALRDWVRMGGTLIVFGSAAQTEQWLEPIFFSALSTAGSGLSTPDPAHPMLRSPNALDFPSYTTSSVAWSYARTEDSDHFTHVIHSGAGDALALSDPGAMGNGTVLLSSFQPWNLLGTGSTGPCDPAALQGTCEALRFLHNSIMVSYRELYLDYGPELPENQRVASITRIATLPHRDLDRDIEILIQLHVF